MQRFRPFLLGIVAALLAAMPLGAQSIVITTVPDTALHLLAVYHTSSGRAGYYDAPVTWRMSGGAAIDVNHVLRLDVNAGVSHNRAVFVTPVDTGHVWIVAALQRKSDDHPLMDSVSVAVQRRLTVALAPMPVPPPPDTTVVVEVPHPPVDTTITPTPTPPVSDSDWTFCSGTGQVCLFLGRRVVRLADDQGRSVSQVAYHQVPCAAYGFGGQQPDNGMHPMHCDYGPIQTEQLANPMPGMSPAMPDFVVVPLGSQGADGPRSNVTHEQPVFTDGSGSFRTTCSLARYAFDDPIVFPGEPGRSHLHAFFGNTGISAYTDSASIASSGSSTCRGGTLNRTAYWTPAVYDKTTGQVITPDEGVFYYKTGYNIEPAVVQPMPTGLRMIAGDSKNTNAPQRFVSWGCRDGAAQNMATIPTTCRVGDAVRLTVIFPQCWDGVHLDSPDHKSHMAYPDYRNSPQRSMCPASHPITLPEVTEHFDYPVLPGSNPANWRLSSDLYALDQPGGYSAHADWMMGWDAATMRTIATKCLEAAVDCGVGSIGNGTTLY